MYAVTPSFVLYHCETTSAYERSIAMKPRNIPDLKMRMQDDPEARPDGFIRLAYGHRSDLTGAFLSATVLVQGST